MAWIQDAHDDKQFDECAVHSVYHTKFYWESWHYCMKGYKDEQVFVKSLTEDLFIVWFLYLRIFFLVRSLKQSLVIIEK